MCNTQEKNLQNIGKIALVQWCTQKFVHIKINTQKHCNMMN